MKIGQAKSVQIDTYHGLSSSAAKASGGAEDSSLLEAVDPTQQQVHDFFNLVSNGGSEYPNGSPAADPVNDFQTLRAALEGASPAAPGAYTVPTAEELHIKYPSGNFFADGSIDAEYQKLNNVLVKRQWDLNQEKGNGALTPSQHKAIQAELAQIAQALNTLEQEVGNAHQIAVNTRALYQKELDLVPKVGTEEIDALSADLNGDGMVGDPLGVHYLTGKQTIDGIDKFALLDSDNFQLRYTPDGIPLSKTTLNPAYEWNVADATTTGLQVDTSTSASHTKPGKLTLDCTGNELQLNTYAGSKNTLTTDINFPIPETITVQTNADGKPSIDSKGHYKAYMPEGGYDGAFQAPLDDSGHVQEGFMQVRVAEVEVRGANKENPNDVIVVMKDANNHELFTVTLKDATTKRLMFSDGSATAAPNGEAQAGEKKDPNATRTSPVHFHVASDFRNALMDQDVSLSNEYSFAQKSGQLHSFNPQFIDNSGDTVTDDTFAPSGMLADKTPVNGVPGIAVVGLTGVLEGTQFNDIFDVPPPADNVHKTDPEYATVVNAGSGYNAVFASHGDHYITGATYVNIDSGDHEGDYNYIQTPGLLEFYGTKSVDKTGSDGQTFKVDQPVKYGANPKITVHVNATGGEVDVDNLVEQVWNDTTTLVYNKTDMNGNPIGESMNKNGPMDATTSTSGTSLDPAVINNSEKAYTDGDLYDINTGTERYSNSIDLDITKILSAEQKITAIDVVEQKKTKATEDALGAINGEGPVDEKGDAIQEQAWEAYGPLYNEAQTEMTAFFGEYSSWSGVKDTTAGMGSATKSNSEQDLNQALGVPAVPTDASLPSV